MAEQVPGLCEQLVRAVTVIMEPGSAQEHRLEALRFCEDFKETCPVCVPCGLQLAEKTQAPVIRHFGLQVLEHVVKFRWNNLEHQEKVILKERVMGLIGSGIRPILEEEAHIKDVLARIVVEMIKREWPQHWPDMLSELDTLTKNGEVQTELVMLILLRLAEDVVTFQSLPSQRRRDIQSTMTQNMDKLFSFMLGILADSVHHYQRLKGDLSQKDKCHGLCRVALATLNTLAGYIDWVAMNHITAQDCQLLQMLCLMLSEEELQVEVAECLLIAVSRKGKLEDRLPLLNLFADNPMHCIMTAAQTAHGEGLQEKRYIFLKRLCQVLCALGSQLCAFTASPDNNVQIPLTFGKYIKSLLDFTAHPSQFLKSATLMTWGSFFRQEKLAKDPALVAILPEFLKISIGNLAKVGYPSKNDSPSCEYSRLDFDSDEDFHTFFNFFKSMMGDVLRLVGRLDPLTSFQMARDWLQFQLSAPLDPGPKSSKAGEGLCTMTSPSYIQWEAMTFFCESLIYQVLRVLPKEELPITQGVELLQQVVKYETKDPLILSFVFTNLSTLLPFVRYMNGFMPYVLSKLFSAVTFELEIKEPRVRSVKALRRHACSFIIKICRDSPDLVLSHFQLLCSQAMLLVQDNHLTQMEKYALLEAQVLINNHFKNYEKQKNFLSQLLGPATSLWLAQGMQRALSSPEEFIAYVGADILRGREEEEVACQANRAQLSSCLYAVEAVLRRSRWPSDPEEAKSGGFVLGHTADGAPVYRNPCCEDVLKVLDSIFSLARTLNNLYLPEVMEKMGDFYAKCLDIMEAEKKFILGQMPILVDAYDVSLHRSPLERMLGFSCFVFESCYQSLGSLGPSLMQDFYSIPDLAGRLANSAFSNLSNVPDFRLRAMIRIFVKPFILSCPPEYYKSLLCPILGPLLNFLQQRLSQKWLTSAQDCGEENGELNAESSEILELELARLLTREMVELLVVLCVAKKNPEQGAKNTDMDRRVTQEDAEDEEMMSMEGASQGSLELSDLGNVLIASEEVSTALLIAAFSPLVWEDTPACHKAATQLCWPLLKQVISAYLPADAAMCFFTNILRGLQKHGQHDACNSSLVTLAFQIYEALRPRFTELRAVMEQIPEVNLDLLEQFDSKLLSLGQKASEKKRKDHFRKLLSGCIGKPLGEQFRKEVHIRNLPSLFRKKGRPVMDEEAILGGCPEALPALFRD